MFINIRVVPKITSTSGFIGSWLCFVRLIPFLSSCTSAAADNQCGGVLTDESGAIITSPGYPNQYQDNSQCVWTLTDSFGYPISLTFTNMDIESESSCSYDSVEVRDGIDEQANLLGRYCGTTIPHVLTTTQNRMFVKFKSDGSVSGKGFRATYMSCGAVLSDVVSGIITSPDYPNLYQDNTQCVWTLTDSFGDTISLTFTNMDIETHPSCIHDYVEVRDGIDEEANVLGRYCGTTIPIVLTTTHNQMFVKFKSDGSVRKKGFRATYLSCGGVLTGVSGIITSPHYPNQYQHKAQCVWTLAVSVGDTISLTFTNMDTEFHSSCQFDYVEVREGIEEEANLIGRYCGTTIPLVLTTTQNQIFVKFKSDGSVSGTGFRATYTVGGGGVSVQHSVTSRSTLLMWHITDIGITNYLILVMNGQSCLQQIQFTKNGHSNPLRQGRSCSQLKNASYKSNMVIRSPLTYNVTDLLPYTDYTVQFTPYTNADAEDVTTLRLKTLEEVPGVVTGIDVTVEGATEVYVCWQIPQINPGVTNYNILVIDQEEDSNQKGSVFKRFVVAGYPNNCIPIGNLGGLEEFWQYRIDINAITSMGSGDTAHSEKFRTVATAPGKLQFFRIDQIPDDFISVNVVWQAPSKRDRNSIITQYTIIYTCTDQVIDQGEGNQTEDQTVNVTAQGLLSQNQTKQLFIKPEYTCNFTIYAISQEGLRGLMSNIWQHETLPGPPPTPTVNVISCPEEKPPVTETQFDVQINTSLFRDNTNGHVTDYGIIVASTDHPDTVDDSRMKEYLSATNFQGSFPTWYKAKPDGFPPYRATPLNWDCNADSPRTRVVSGSDIITFHVGSDRTCSDASIEDTYCNGPVSDGGEYSVKAFACTTGGCTETEYQGNCRTKAVTSEGSNIGMIVGVTVAVVVILAIIIIILVVRRRRLTEGTPHGAGVTSDLSNDEYETVQFNNVEKDYEELRVRKVEIQRDRITILSEKLGKGKYGDVWKGVLVNNSNGNDSYIAIRQIKAKDPLSLCAGEIEVREKIGRHPNITSFIGSCLYEEGTLFMLTSFESNGDLKMYLRERRPTSLHGGKLSEFTLLGFALDVSRGMAYLTKHEIIHTDLRTRHILVGERMVARISGFHSSTISGVADKGRGKKETHTRWLSPEILLKNEDYTNKSDVWAFGVLMWEIMMFGATPYSEMKLPALKKFINDGFRLSCPKSCGNTVYHLMLLCWRGSPHERPQFVDISNRLESLRSDVQQYDNVAVYENINFEVEHISNDA